MDTHTSSVHPLTTISLRRRIVGLVVLGIALATFLSTLSRPKKSTPPDGYIDRVLPGWEYELIATKPDSADNLNTVFLVRNPITRRVTILTYPTAACDTVPLMRPRTLVMREVQPVDFWNHTGRTYRVNFNPIRLDQIQRMPNYYRTAPPSDVTAVHAQFGTGNDHA